MARASRVAFGLLAGWLLTLATVTGQQPPLIPGDDVSPRLGNVGPTYDPADPALRPVIGPPLVAEPRIGMPFVSPPPQPTLPYFPPTNVSFLDFAVPMNVARLRFDAAYFINRPTRSEFIIRNSGPKTGGMPLPERKLDGYQDLSAYVEYAFMPQVSGFVEAPYRSINPEFNHNADGFGDMRAGFKIAGLQLPELTATAQFAVRAPVGNASTGTGSMVTRLEPAILLTSQVTDELILEAEIQYQAALGGTFLAGDFLRLGMGASYIVPLSDDWWIAPVWENQLWTILSGREALVYRQQDTIVRINRQNRTVRFVDFEDSSGQGILNTYLGFRAGLGNRFDLYAGYGRALTGDVWYKNTWRVEFRWLY